MHEANCYNLLGLGFGANLSQVKEAYRRLARKYHPDLNPGNRDAQVKFIELTEAYKFLLGADKHQQPQTESAPVQRNSAPRQSPKEARIPQLSEYEQHLKLHAYETLKMLLKESRLARAIALVEGLAQRLPRDPEVRQWQAITYQQWARQMAREHKLHQAKAYLHKALQTDPYNRSLWKAVQQDLHQVERMLIRR